MVRWGELFVFRRRDCRKRRRSVAVSCSIFSIPIALVFGGSASLGQNNCPVIIMGPCGIESTEPHGSCDVDGVGSSSYDLVNGTFACATFSNYTFGNTSLLQAVAQYTLSNVSPGVPVDLHARFTVEGEAVPVSEICPPCAFNSASISWPGNSWSAGPLNGTEIVDMNFTVLPGQPFEIFCGFDCSSEWSGWASLRGRMQFLDVPAGAVITLCQGLPVVGVGQPGTATLALHPSPNPARGSFGVGFVLPSGAPASLAIYDLAGRLVEKRDLDGFGRGRHTVRFGERERFPTGVYLVRLVQGATGASVRQVVLR